jgi:hypothetical protein
MNFLSDEQLAAKGIRGNDVTFWRKRREGLLPRRRDFGRRLKATPEPLAERYLELIAAGYSEADATRLAEQYFTALLAAKSITPA